MEKLILFSRYPVAEKTKTRLIPALGSQGAASLQKHMTERTVHTIESFLQIRKVDFEIRYVDGSKYLLQRWLGSNNNYVDQGKGNLGERLQSAFTEAFKKHANRVIIIGSDCPSITKAHLEQSFALLADNDLVLGPASDGGYYLIGLSQEHPFLFEDIQWGTSSVLKDTTQKAIAAGIITATLPELNDIDQPEDLKNLPENLQQNLQ